MMGMWCREAGISKRETDHIRGKEQNAMRRGTVDDAHAQRLWRV